MVLSRMFVAFCAGRTKWPVEASYASYVVSILLSLEPRYTVARTSLRRRSRSDGDVCWIDRARVPGGAISAGPGAFAVLRASPSLSERSRSLWQRKCCAALESSDTEVQRRGAVQPQKRTR
jgi:hypothetical protein